MTDELLGGKSLGNEEIRPHRHNLLKGFTHRFNKGGAAELSVSAPDQSLKSLDETPRKQESDNGRDSRSSSSARRSSGATGTPSSVWIRGNRGVSPPIPLADRVCVDPALHVNESHAHAHHPGLLRGADFCDAGVPTAASSDLRPNPRSESSSSSAFSVRSAKVQRTISGGEVCTTSVKMAVSRHPGHSHAVKVRPLSQHYPPHGTVVFEETQRADYDPSRNKVGPFTPKMFTPRDSDVLNRISRSNGEERMAPEGLTESSDADDLHTEEEPLFQQIEDVPSPLPSSIASYSTLGSHKGHHYSQAARTPPGLSGFLSTHSLDQDPQIKAPEFSLQHDLEDSAHETSTRSLVHFPLGVDDTNEHGLGNAAPQHADEEFEDLTALIQDEGHEIQNCQTVGSEKILESHSIQDDSKFPVYEGKSEHLVDFCETCSTDEVARRHTIQGCVGFPVSADDQLLKSNIYVQGSIATGPEMHQASHCDEYPVYAGPDKHQIGLCTKCSVPVQDFKGHRASQCSSYPVYNSPDQHHLAACAEFPGVNSVQEHQISRCSRYPVFAGLDQHGLQTCASCSVGKLPATHGIQDCDVVPTRSCPRCYGRPNTHKISQCSKHATQSGAVFHSMESCRTMSLPAVSECHKLQNCGKHSANNDIRQYGVQEDTHHYSKGRMNPPLRFNPSSNTQEASSCQGSQKSHVSRGQILQARRSSVPPEMVGKESSGPHSRLPYVPSFDIAEPGELIQHEYFPELGTEEERQSSECIHGGWSPGSCSDISLRAQHGNVQRETASRNSQEQTRARSVVDYKRTAKWLRELLKYPEAYTSKLTELPESRRQSRKFSTEVRRPSEPTLPTNGLTRGSVEDSINSFKSEPRFDGMVFKRAVSDLERLLTEAISLASQAAGQTGESAMDTLRHLPAPLRLRKRLDKCNDENVLERARGASTPSTESESDAGVSEILLDDQDAPRRPLHKHAATYSGLPERPRLTDIVERSSGCHIRPIRRDSGWQSRKGSGLEKLREQLSFQIPARHSSKKHSKDAAGRANSECFAKKRISDTSKRFDIADDDDFTSCPTEVVEFTPNYDHRKRNQGATKSALNKHSLHPSHHISDEGLPQRDIAGRMMHADHGIILRHRSHVSLRGAQRFNLAKSHRRQPIARD